MMVLLHFFFFSGGPLRGPPLGGATGGSTCWLHGGAAGAGAHAATGHEPPAWAGLAWLGWALVWLGFRLVSLRISVDLGWISGGFRFD